MQNNESIKIKLNTVVPPQIKVKLRGGHIDVQINGMSIVDEGKANILVDGVYSEDNKIASQNTVKAEAYIRENADNAIVGYLDDVNTRLNYEISYRIQETRAINEKIPTEASSSNKLTSKSYVDNRVEGNVEGTPAEDLQNLKIGNKTYGVLGNRNVTAEMIDFASARLANPYTCISDGYAIAVGGTKAVTLYFGNSTVHYSIINLSTNGQRNIVFCVKGLQLYFDGEGAPKSALFVPVKYY